MKNICRICQNAEKNVFHKAREMMFGMRDEFDYLECSNCGTLQICEIPDLSHYYPQDYYSFKPDEESRSDKSLRQRIIARLIGKYLVTGRGFPGKYLVQRYPDIASLFPASLRQDFLNLRLDSKILDFGCGAGNLLKNLRFLGFRNLTGADAFIENDIFYPDGVKIYKKSLAELKPSFDFIMLHHSFEHFPNPLESLREIYRLLSKGNFCLVRIPVKNFAWGKYGVNWFQLDAPRHLFLYTEESFRKLAEKAGFEVFKTIYDSEVHQFYISEQYAQGISMFDERAFRGDFSKSIFTSEQLKKWELQTEVLNREKRGDQACFYLRKT
jgi:SAM-dependent methyltransferase